MAPRSAPEPAAASGGRLRAVLRFVGAVLAVSGVLLLADVGLTLVWQEPVSAFLAARAQDGLERELHVEERRLTRWASVQPAAGESALARAARRYAAGLRRGEAFGRITLPTLDQSYVVAEGTDDDTLRSGPGHYEGTGLPGLRRTVALAGHRTTYLAPFADVDELERGDPIVMTMPYGRFTYRLEQTRIVDPSAYWVTQRGKNRLVLTSCHPPFSAAQRIVLFARLAAATAATPATARRAARPR
jgi:sortase A